MIQITRQLAKVFRSVFKRTFGRQVTMLSVRAGDDGLFIAFQGPTQTLRYHDPQPQEQETLLLPFQVLDDVQGPKAEPVFLNTRRPGVIGASWQQKGDYRELEYEALEPVPNTPAFPEWPAPNAEQPPTFLAALRDAYETTDLESSRYALGCVQLRGHDGVMAATDGRQLLRQSGFSFGFEESVLVLPSKFFFSRELPTDQPIRIGVNRDDKGVFKVAFQVGPWTYWLDTERGRRFPDVDQTIAPVEHVPTTLQLASADAQFLTENLHRLPDGNSNREVTLDLNGKVILRAANATTPRPAELVLRNSHKQGDDLRLCTDRKFLARAATLGFSEIHLPNSESPAIAKDSSRTYVWMLLNPKDAVKPSDDCLRIESPLDTGKRTIPLPSSTRTIPVNRIASTPTSPELRESATSAIRTNRG